MNAETSRICYTKFKKQTGKVKIHSLYCKTKRICIKGTMFLNEIRRV